MHLRNIKMQASDADFPLKRCPDCANNVKLNSKHFSNLK